MTILFEGNSSIHLPSGVTPRNRARTDLRGHGPANSGIGWGGELLSSIHRFGFAGRPDLARGRAATFVQSVRDVFSVVSVSTSRSLRNSRGKIGLRLGRSCRFRCICLGTFFRRSWLGASYFRLSRLCASHFAHGKFFPCSPLGNHVRRLRGRRANLRATYGSSFG